MTAPPKTNVTFRIGLDLLGRVDEIAGRKFGPSRTDLVVAYIEAGQAIVEARIAAGYSFEDAMQALDAMAASEMAAVKAARAPNAPPATKPRKDAA